MTTSFSNDRRDFLVKTAALTGGLALGVRLPTSAQAAQGTPQMPEITHWLVIQPDETVVVRVARSELGQGTFTGLPMLVAEELECDWSNVRAEYADVNEHVRRGRDLGLDVHRRQPRHTRLAGIRAPGRRRRARDADRGCGPGMGRAGGRMQREERRHHASAEQPHARLTARSPQQRPIWKCRRRPSSRTRRTGR